jgi:UDP-N-acetylglucosamine 2-epimerase (non-hydrolysing)
MNEKMNTKKIVVIIAPPLDYFSFQNLILHSKLVLTHSGGIQEETTFRGIPCLTVRPNTERPCTVDQGSNEVLPLEPKTILKRVHAIYGGELKEGVVPALWDGKATQRVVGALKRKMGKMIE